MGKANRKKNFSRKEADQQSPTRAVPNRPLLSLALIGMAITAYLTITTWTGQAVAGCLAGSGCDLVLNSRWSKLFGLPTSLWGFLAYLSLAGIAFIKSAAIHWKLAWVVSPFGVLYSIYLTVISFVELNASCPYCLTSLALMTAILGTVTYQRRGAMPNFSRKPWIVGAAAGVLIAVFALHLHYAGLWGKGLGLEEPVIRALAEHLAKTNAKFHGTYWCPHCKEQKEIFGACAHRLPYIECSLQGPRASQTKICKDAGIQLYPTWIFDGRRYEGVLTPEELARYSGFKGGFP